MMEGGNRSDGSLEQLCSPVKPKREVIDRWGKPVRLDRPVLVMDVCMLVIFGERSTSIGRRGLVEQSL